VRSALDLNAIVCFVKRVVLPGNDHFDWQTCIQMPIVYTGWWQSQSSTSQNLYVLADQDECKPQDRHRRPP